uniref:Carboxylesterase type B domain-containing protein n=1 Tax=Daphnia galeata TaxID=27404 RepID=A0A8J2W3I8_9CRUS|nr:unnamed protein product [Daphnia galeata]
MEKSFKCFNCLLLLTALFSSCWAESLDAPASQIADVIPEDSSLIINTLSGQVRGMTAVAATAKEVDVWNGIPLGELRFRHPKPMDPWNDIRDT